LSARGKSRKNCTSGCPTGGHKSWGECLRAKGLQVQPNIMGASAQKAWDRELNSFESATRQGVMPEGTKQHQIDAAMKVSDSTGVAYKRG